MSDSLSSSPATPQPTLLNVTPPTPTTPSPTHTTPTTASLNEPVQGQSPLSTAPAAPTPAAPESYTFTAPEGKTLDQDTVNAFSPIARELGLSQAAAQRLVDFYNARAEQQAVTISSAISAQGEKWMAEAQADPALSGKLAQDGPINRDIAKMFDRVFAQDLDTRTAFQSAMNFTMSGNNPAFIKALWAMSKFINEGTYVTGGGPAETGQNPTGTTSRPSLAQAMYGHLNN